MGSQSTRSVSRGAAKARILEVTKAALDHNYKKVEDLAYETDYGVEKFINTFDMHDIKHLDKWTNRMLANKLDEPFFRWSMFDNYSVEDQEDCE